MIYLYVLAAAWLLAFVGMLAWIATYCVRQVIERVLWRRDETRLRAKLAAEFSQLEGLEELWRLPAYVKAEL